jgi:hypothetical protein
MSTTPYYSKQYMLIAPSQTAPSWSWLAMRGPVDWIVYRHVSWGHYAIVNPIIAEVKECTIELASSDPMGRISAGRLVILCHLRPAHNRYTQRRAGGDYIALDWERFDTGYDLDRRRNIQGSWYCVLAYNESREDRKPFAGEESSYVRGHAPWANYIFGLILQIAQESPRVYRRIGMFAHPWTKKGPNPLAEQFPEFADVVDPRALEREKIVVI